MLRRPRRRCQRLPRSSCAFHRTTTRSSTPISRRPGVGVRRRNARFCIIWRPDITSPRSFPTQWPPTSSRAKPDPMRLERIVLREIRLPLKEPFRISSGEVRERRILLLEMLDAGGASTWSECVAGETPNYSSETIDTSWIVLQQWVAPRVLGREFDHPGEVHDLLERDFRGHNMSKAAVEMGMWGLAALVAGEPLGRFIGGTREQIATGISLGIQAS